MEYKVKSRLAAAGVAASAALAAVPAQAQEATLEGPYLGVNLGTARLKDDDRLGVPTDRSSTGGKIYGGYNFGPYLGLEGGYTNTGKFDSSSGNLRGTGLFADVVARMPFGNNFAGLARLGVFRGKLEDGRNGVDLTDTNTNVKGGLGVEYAFTRNHAVRGEWERYRFEANDGDKIHTDLYTVGYKFTF